MSQRFLGKSLDENISKITCATILNNKAAFRRSVEGASGFRSFRELLIWGKGSNFYYEAINYSLIIWGKKLKKVISIMNAV